MLPIAFLFAAIVGSLPSGFQHGFAVSSLTSIKMLMQQWMFQEKFPGLIDFDDSDLLFTHISASLCIGGVIGGFLSGYISSTFGRKGGLMINTFIGDAAAFILVFTKVLHWPYTLLIGRILWGVNCGMHAALSPTYLTEIAPSKIRGAIGSLYQLFIVISILFGQIVTLSDVMGTQDLWPWVFIFSAIMGILQFVLFFFVPESPKYILFKTDDETKARKAMNKLYGGKGDIDGAFAEIKGDVALAKSQPKITMKGFFSNRVYVIPLLYGFFLMYAQQFSGINAVMFYSTQIFQETKMSEKNAQLATAGVGIVNFLTTILSMWLVEKLGRKKLLAIGFSGMVIFTSLLCACLFLADAYTWASYTCLIWVYGFVFCFASGAGSIPWIMMSEMFDTTSRPVAIAFIVPSNWVFNYLVAFLFPVIQNMIGAFVFIIFIASQVLAIVVVMMFLPETKGKNIEEIVEKFK